MPLIERIILFAALGLIVWGGVTHKSPTENNLVFASLAVAALIIFRRKD